MFYAAGILRRRGPLAKLWTAATLGTERIARSFFLHVEVSRICADLEGAIHAGALSLRLQAYLLFGLARIYERQVMAFCAAAEEWYGRVRMHATVPVPFARGRYRNARAASSLRPDPRIPSETAPERYLQGTGSANERSGHQGICLAVAGGRRRHTHSSITWGLDPAAGSTAGFRASIVSVVGNMDALWLLYVTETQVPDRELACNQWLRQPLPLETESPEFSESASMLVGSRASGAPLPLCSTPYRVQHEERITLSGFMSGLDVSRQSVIPELDERGTQHRGQDADMAPNIAPRRLLEALDAVAVPTSPIEAECKGILAATLDSASQAMLHSTITHGKTITSGCEEASDQQAHSRLQSLSRQHGRRLNASWLQLDAGNALTIPPQRLQAMMRQTRDLIHPTQRRRRVALVDEGSPTGHTSGQSLLASRILQQTQILERALDADATACGAIISKTLVDRGLVRGLFAATVGKSCPARSVFETLVQHQFDQILGPSWQAQGPYAGSVAPWRTEPSADASAVPHEVQIEMLVDTPSVPEQVRATSLSQVQHGELSVDHQLPGAYSSAIRSASSDSSIPIPRVAVPALPGSGSLASQSLHETRPQSPQSPPNLCTPMLAARFTDLASVGAHDGSQGPEASMHTQRSVLTPATCRDTIIRLAMQLVAEDAPDAATSSWIRFDSVLAAITTTAATSSNVQPPVQPVGFRTPDRPGDLRLRAAVLFATTLKLAAAGEVTVAQTAPYATIQLCWNLPLNVSAS